MTWCAQWRRWGEWRLRCQGVKSPHLTSAASHIDRGEKMMVQAHFITSSLSAVRSDRLLINLSDTKWSHLSCEHSRFTSVLLERRETEDERRHRLLHCPVFVRAARRGSGGKTETKQGSIRGPVWGHSLMINLWKMIIILHVFHTNTSTLELINYNWFFYNG